MLNNHLKTICLGLLLTFASYSTITIAAPQVVVSIKPIHSLVANIMQGVATPQLLLPDYASPHTFQLKPSNLKQLQKADLIIWVGPELENFLEKPLSQMHPSLGILTLREIPNLKRLTLRHGRNWGSDHGHDHEHENLDADNLDPHFWLSTDNAIVIGAYLTDYLAKKDPQHKKLYEKNLKQLTLDLKTLKKELQTILQPVHQQPFLVYHDGYQYFEKEFDLNAVGTMVINPHLPLSANGLKTIQTLIKTNHIHCVFRETEFTDKTIYQSLQKLNITVAELDPLGAHQVPGPEAYAKTLYAIGETMQECLKTY